MPKWLIKLSDISFHLVYPFIISIFRVIQIKSRENMLNSDKDSNIYFNNTKANLAFVFIPIMFLSEILGGSLYFYEFYKSKRGNDYSQIVQRISKIKITPIQNVIKKQTTKLHIIILSLTVLDLIGSPALRYFGDANLNFIIKVFEIFIYAFLSVKILNCILYRHQYFSIILIVIGAIITTFGLQWNNQQLDLTQWVILIIAIIFWQSLFGVKNTIEKWLINLQTIESLYILFVEGVFGLVMSLIINAFLYFNGILNTIVFNPDVYCLFAIELLSGSVINVCIFKTNEHFSPIHLLIADLFSSFINYLVDIFIGDKKSNVLVSLIGYLVLIFGIFVYNELVILNCFFSLGEYTKGMIRSRAQKEYSNAVNVEIQQINIELTMIDDISSDDCLNETYSENEKVLPSSSIITPYK